MDRLHGACAIVVAGTCCPKAGHAQRWCNTSHLTVMLNHSVIHHRCIQRHCATWHHTHLCDGVLGTPKALHHKASRHRPKALCHKGSADTHTDRPSLEDGFMVTIPNHGAAQRISTDTCNAVAKSESCCLSDHPDTHTERPSRERVHHGDGPVIQLIDHPQSWCGTRDLTTAKSVAAHHISR